MREDRPHPAIGRRDFLTMAAVTPLFAAATAWGQASDKIWRVGVIGHTGRGGYGHGLDTMWNLLPETRVVGFADADERGREKEQSRLPDVPAFADYRAMLAELKPEMVAIGPRHIDEHRDMIFASIDAGARGIYMEKPFCRTPAEADEIVEACQRSGTKIGVAHRNRYHPALPAVSKAIQDGAIGDLLEIRCRGKEDQRGGCLDLWVLGSHELDLSLPLAGRPIACSAAIQQGNRPATKAEIVQGSEGVGPILGDRVHARFEMENGIPLFFDSVKDVGTRGAAFAVQLVGNQGQITMRIDSDPLAYYVPGNPFHPKVTPTTAVPISSAGIGVPEPIENLRKELSGHVIPARDLIAAIEEDRLPLCNEHSCRTVIEMIHGVFASHVQQGARVTFPLHERGHGLSPWL